LNAGSTISMGSSMVQTFTSGVARDFAATSTAWSSCRSPSDPVTSTMPLGWLIMPFQRREIVAGEAELLEALERSSTSGSKIRMTSFSPKAVGRVDRRSSSSRCPRGSWS
jgi:hypothetical protein